MKTREEKVREYQLHGAAYRTGRELVECRDRRTAKRRTPWACRWIKVEGGWLAFQFMTDFELWKAQR